MKGISLLSFLTPAQKEKIELSEANYSRYARVFFSVVSFDNNELVVKIWQKENEAGKYLSVRELIDRGRAIFEELLPAGVSLHFRPIPFKSDDLTRVTAEYVQQKMAANNIILTDLVKLLNIDKATLSRTLSAPDMTKSSKAMFYYLFKYLELKQKK